MHYREAGREAPFAGMLDHAKWLFRDDLVVLLRELGFADIHDAGITSWRHGPRWLVYARR
jgi:tRNA (mo5U34)-methyltransferase